jgi:hypothetical protein
MSTVLSLIIIGTRRAPGEAAHEENLRRLGREDQRRLIAALIARQFNTTDDEPETWNESDIIQFHPRDDGKGLNPAFLLNPFSFEPQANPETGWVEAWGTHSPCEDEIAPALALHAGNRSR